MNPEYYSEDGGVVCVERKPMTDRQLKLAADAIDFAIQPRIPTQADVEAQAAISAGSESAPKSPLHVAFRLIPRQFSQISPFAPRKNHRFPQLTFPPGFRIMDRQLKRIPGSGRE